MGGSKLVTGISDSVKLSNLAADMRKSAIEMGHSAGRKGAHFGGALSCIEILACLYSGIMDISPEKAGREPRDIFIASKAHCVLALYTALAHRGFFPREELATFEGDGSYLSGHPVMKEEWGIEISGGSLGMGLSQGIGVALGYRRKGYDQHIFVLLGDGECDEGSVWEGIMSAAHYKLDNLVVIVDKNQLQYDGSTEAVMGLTNLAAKFESFGFETYEVEGHNIDELYEVLSKAVASKNGKPKAVIANTVKGKGISFMEGHAEWHHGVLTDELYQKAVAELG